MSGCELAGAGVLVTRAEHQAAALCHLIDAHGGRALRFPALEITGPADPAAVKRLLASIDGFDMAIFISPNAVTRGLPLLPDGCLPGSILIAAVGQGTRRALAAAGQPVDIFPEQRYDSEGLLAMPAMRSVAGRRILIFRGQSGRAMLGETLAARGAGVSYAGVYRRQCPQVDAGPLIGRWRSEVDVVTATSVELLENLLTLLGESGSGLLRDTPLVVISERMRERAEALGCRRLLQALRADDHSILEAICRWRSG